MPIITVHNAETGEVTTFKAGYGANLRQAAQFQDIDLYRGIWTQLNCRGMGFCGTCLIEVDNMENVSDHSLMEKLHKVGENQKLACRTKIYGDITIKANLTKD